MKKTMQCNRVNLLASIQLALLDAVTPALRAVTASFNEKEIHLIFYYDGLISELDSNLARIAAKKVNDDFNNMDLKLEILQLDKPKKTPYLDNVVYARYEG